MIQTDSNSIPLALYIHIPWCEKKCPYCDFNSHLAKTEINETAYINDLLDDLQQDLARHKTALAERKLSSIFIGGGTPSLFSADSYKTLLHGVKSMIGVTPDIEITSEANPGSSEAGKFMGFKEAGVNRLSIGVQSFNQTHLTALGRAHDSSEALNAATFAKQAGFDNFNLDLMFGLPGQALEQSLNDVQQAIKLAPSHLSCYQLTIEPNTLFHHKPPITPDDESLWKMQTRLQTELAKAGYQQYEVSAYARADKQCRHNLNYWQYGDYLGIGAGAHGKVTEPNGTIHRSWKIKHPASYMRATDNYNGGVEIVSAQQLPLEFMMNALRLTDGFDLSLYEQRTQRPLADIEKNIQNHQKLGLVEIKNHYLQTTDRGQQFLDSMLQDYLPKRKT